MKELNQSEIEHVSGGVRVSHIVLKGAAKILSTALSKVDWGALAKPSKPIDGSEPTVPMSPGFGNW